MASDRQLALKLHEKFPQITICDFNGDNWKECQTRLWMGDIKNEVGREVKFVPKPDGFLQKQYYKNASMETKMIMMERVVRIWPELGLFVGFWPFKIVAENAINSKNRNDLFRGTRRPCTPQQMASLGAPRKSNSPDPHPIFADVF